MADQTPAEMRERARRLRNDLEMDLYGAPDAEDGHAGADALDRLADVIEYAEAVMRERSDTIARGMRVGTAESFLHLARGETNGRESDA